MIVVARVAIGGSLLLIGMFLGLGVALYGYQPLEITAIFTIGSFAVGVAYALGYAMAGASIIGESVK